MRRMLALYAAGVYLFLHLPLAILAASASTPRGLRCGRVFR